MCAAGMLPNAVATSLRRSHSPAAINDAANRPPRKMRTPGPISPASIEYCTRKMPPSASASPPIHTTQLAPKRSSKLFVGGASRGGKRGTPSAGSDDETDCAGSGSLLAVVPSVASIMRSAGESRRSPTKVGGAAGSGAAVGSAGLGAKTSSGEVCGPGAGAASVRGGRRARAGQRGEVLLHPQDALALIAHHEDRDQRDE